MKSYCMDSRERIGHLNINIFPNNYDPAIIQKIIDEERKKDQGEQIPLEKPIDMPYEPPEQPAEKPERVVIIPPQEEKQTNKGYVIIQM